MGEVLKKIEEYYVKEQEKKIFCKRVCIEDREFQILYDYDKSDEIDRFVSNFTTYFPYYVYNEDLLEHINIKGGIETELLRISTQTWKESPSVPKRPTKSNGIFGEVFLDFYERVVKQSKLITTYVSRRDFRSNSENKGFDNMFFKVINGEVEYVFAETKFVASKSSAVTELVNDIKGLPAKEKQKAKKGHLTTEFMNDYISFVVEKSHFFSKKDREIIEPFINELNRVLISGQRQFLPFLIENNISIRCVFFAIFPYNSVNPKDFMENYDQIEKEAKEHLDKIGFKNYIIEIVFVPTMSESMLIKKAIEDYYG